MGFISYIRDEIKVVRERDPAIKSNMEVLLYPSFKVILHYRVAHKLYLKKHYFLARWVSQRAVRKTGIEIHPGATIGKGLFIDHGSGVIIGETAVLGNNVTLYQGVTLGGTGKEQGKRHPTLEDNVMVSAGAKILGSSGRDPSSSRRCRPTARWSACRDASCGWEKKRFPARTWTTCICRIRCCRTSGNCKTTTFGCMANCWRWRND